VHEVQGYVVIMANEPTRPLGGTIMNGVIIKKETTTEKALAGNNVLMVGKFLNKREMEELQVATNKRVMMVGRMPNKREIGMSKAVPVAAVANQSPTIEETEERVEIAEFFLRAQEEMRIARIKQQQAFEANKKKAPVKKPSLAQLIVNKLKSL